MDIYTAPNIYQTIENGGVRWKRLIPPLWCAVAICLGVTIALSAPVEWASLLSYLLCIQGIGNIAFRVMVPTLPGMGQTWFLTILLACYVLMLLLKRHQKLEIAISKKWIASSFVAIIAQIGLSYIGIQTVYILQFFIGYFLSKIDTNEVQNKWVSRKSIIILTISSVVLGILRLLANRYIDGTIFYDRIIARWSFSVIAIWLIAVQIIVCRSALAEKLVKSKVWRILDIASYPLFLTHYMFLTGPMKVMEWFKGTSLQITMFIIFTVLSAGIITIVSSRNSIGEIVNNK